MAKTIAITPKKYSTLRGYKNVNYVNKCLLENRTDLLPGIVKVEAYGRFRLLLVKADSTGQPIVPELTENERTASESRSTARLKASRQEA